VSNTVRVGLCQISSTDDPERNLDLVRDGVARATAEGARVVLFPEATMARFGVPLGPIAQPLDGPWATAVRKIADAAGVLVIAGMYTPAPDDRVHNTLLITGLGEHRGYDKIHLYDAFGFTESHTVAPGSTPVTVSVDEVTLGVATCYDVRFPELFRALADAGAAGVLLGASWGAGPGKVEQWELLVRARALDSSCWVAACGQADPGHPSTAPTGVGHSLVADPFGRVSATLGPDPALTVVDLDPALAEEARRTVAVLANRRL
jgi:predicted amidohydrolase